MALIQHPANEIRLDLVYVGTDGNLWHSWNADDPDGMRGLSHSAPAHLESWGNPGTPLAPLTAGATWDAAGQYLNVVAATVDGAIWAQVRSISGTHRSGWIRITSQAVSLPPKGQPGPPGPPGPAYDDTAITARVSALEALVAKVKAIFS